VTGFNAVRDLEIGATLIAGGWALNRWAASRMPQAAPEMATDAGLTAAVSDDDAPE
jgi:hypothetical protein